MIDLLVDLKKYGRKTKKKLQVTGAKAARAAHQAVVRLELLRGVDRITNALAEYYKMHPYSERRPHIAQDIVVFAGLRDADFRKVVMTANNLMKAYGNGSLHTLRAPILYKSNDNGAVLRGRRGTLIIRICEGDDVEQLINKWYQFAYTITAFSYIFITIENQEKLGIQTIPVDNLEQLRNVLAGKKKG